MLQCTLLPGLRGRPRSGGVTQVNTAGPTTNTQPALTTGIISQMEMSSRLLVTQVWVDQQSGFESDLAVFNIRTRPGRDHQGECGQRRWPQADAQATPAFRTSRGKPCRILKINNQRVQKKAARGCVTEPKKRVFQEGSGQLA